MGFLKLQKEFRFCSDLKAAAAPKNPNPCRSKLRGRYQEDANNGQINCIRDIL